MQVFIYEYFTGGGAGELPQGPEASLLAEAAAMVRAVTADFVAHAATRVITTRDERLPPHPTGCEVITIRCGASDLETIGRLARESDWTVVIAPETAGALLRRAKLVEGVSGRLLSPGSELIEIAANKQATAEVLRRAGVPVPRGEVWAGGDSFNNEVSFPLVAKPMDGCGSQGVRLVVDGEELKELGDGQFRPSQWRVEEYVEGAAASVSVLCGPHRNWPLVACEQRLSVDGQFSYLGGRLPLPDELDRRARSLAMRAIEAMPPTVGYVGVDLVLGDAEDGSGDRVIEINPRLTTSYVGLRAASHTNLAAAMLAVACGEEPVLRFRSEPVEFKAGGEIIA